MTALQAIAPDQVAPFREATQALDAKNFERAASLFTGVTAAVPRFAPALRRLCSAEIAAGRRNVGIARCREALKLNNEPATLSALALALIYQPPGEAPSALTGDIKEALDLARKAREAAPDDLYALTALCAAASQSSDEFPIRECIRESEGKVPRELLDEYRLSSFWVFSRHERFDVAGSSRLAEMRRIVDDLTARNPNAPGPQLARCFLASKTDDTPALHDCVNALGFSAINDWRTHIFAAELAIREGDPARAEKAIQSAERLHAPIELLQKVSALANDSQPSPLRGPLVAGIGAWLVLLGVIASLGSLLNRFTLNTIERNPSSASTTPNITESRVRHAYAAVLWLSCIFYYVSIPLVLLSVVGLVGFVIYGMLYVGHIHIGLTLTLLLVGLTTLAAIVRSLIVPSDTSDPGVPLDLEKHPAFNALLKDVSAAVGTRSVDRVYLTAGTDLGVYERGGLWSQLRGNTERCLILGLGVLKGFELGPFRAVLAHEYGHFSNRDTAGGGFALAVRRSLLTMGVNLAKSGAATWYNPAWWFFRGFFALFTRISQGASRLQEVLADRWSVKLYGAEAFCTGLEHVIERSIFFDAHVQTSLREALDERRPIRNLYRHRPSSPPDPDKIAEALDEAIQREPSPYDSHPSPTQRFALARAQLTATTSPADDAETKVWSLFDDRRDLEQALTLELLNTVENRIGVSFVRASNKASPTAPEAP